MNSAQGGITLRSAGSRLLGPLALGRQFWVLEEDPSLSLHGSFCSISVGGLEAGSDSLSLEEGVGRDATMGDERLPGKQAGESRRSARGKDAGAVEPAGRPVSRPGGLCAPLTSPAGPPPVLVGGCQGLRTLGHLQESGGHLEDETV